MIEIKTGKIDYIVNCDFEKFANELNSPEKFITITFYQVYNDKKETFYYKKVCCLHKDEIEVVEPSVIYEWDKIKDKILVYE